MSLLSEQTIQNERGSYKRAKHFYETQVKDHLTSVMQDFIRGQRMRMASVIVRLGLERSE